MEIVFPGNVSIFSWEGDISLSCKVWIIKSLTSLLGWHVLVKDVHIPNTDDEIAEFAVSLNLRAHNTVILNKIVAADPLLIPEEIICAMHCSEQVVELKFGLFCVHKATEDIWVTIWTESILYFIQFQVVVLVNI